MKKITYITFLGLIIIFSACENILMESNPETTNTAVFNEYATLVKEKYAMLEFKNVNIDALIDSLNPLITDKMDEETFFNHLSIITARLRDAHSNLFTLPINEETFYSYDNLAGYPIGFDYSILTNNYVAESINPSIVLLLTEEDYLRVIYGTLPQDNDIAYVWIPSWDVEISDKEIEKIFTDLGNAKGMIFDMRQNGGGDPSLAAKFASYFTDKPVYTGFERFKIGPGINDFSDSKIYLEPTSSSNKFLKPVMVLTGRFCYSASTTFAYSVNPLDNITFIGQRTGGGSGSVADGYLANGWNWSLSTSEFIDHLGNHLDDGFDPDISVVLDTLDTTKDEVIERAIIELQ